MCDTTDLGGEFLRLHQQIDRESFEDWRVEQYDLARDAGEERDLAAARPESAQQMKKLLTDWRKEVDAQMPAPNPQPVEPFGPQGVPRPKVKPQPKRPSS